ncbi:MAG: M23 family metallopeptidase, partial [Spirochaetes bacterium]|nr:M23 family metallopeptidase [Spirochaetota bacterium]
ILFCQKDKIMDQLVLENAVISSGFGESRLDHYHTGIDLAAKNKPVKSLESCETVFYNINRKNSLFYGNGNFVVLEDVEAKKRYSYSHLKEKSLNRAKMYYQKDEIIAIAGNSGHSTGPHLHLEIEDLENRRLVNPIEIIPFDDTRKPILEDIYFITRENEKVSILKNKYIHRGGKMFIKCRDPIDFSPYPINPYSIEVIIDGKDFYQLKFDYLKKVENYYVLSESGKKFSDLYVNNSDFDFYLTDFFALPGDISIKIIISDYAGNKVTYNRPIRILPPKNTAS